MRKSYEVTPPDFHLAYFAGWYGSTKHVFAALVALNARGCSTLLAHPLAIPLMK